MTIVTHWVWIPEDIVMFFSGVFGAWFIVTSVIQGWKELQNANPHVSWHGSKVTYNCPTHNVSHETPEEVTDCPSMKVYRSTLAYQIIAFSPIFRLIVALWRPRV